MANRKKERTVAQLLSIRSSRLQYAFQHFRNNGKPRHIYIYCRSLSIAKRFLADAEAEGFLFCDGTAPTGKEAVNLYALNDDFTMSYTSMVAYMMFGRKAVGNVMWVDYGKYVSEEKSWLPKET